MPRLPRLSGNDRDKHRGRSGGDTLKAKDGENTKTTTGGFDPDGPNLDYDIEVNQGGRRRPQRRQQATHGPRSEHGAVVGRTKQRVRVPTPRHFFVSPSVSENTYTGSPVSEKTSLAAISFHPSAGL